MIIKDCDNCIKRKTMYCPNSKECYNTFEKPFHLNNIEALVQLQQKENIIKEVRETLINSKEYKMAKEMNLTSKMSILIELLEILDKDITKKSDYNYEKVEKENNNGI